MGRKIQDRVSKIIDAYFNFPRDVYARIVSDIRTDGGLLPQEVRLLKDRLPFIHSDTIIRQAGMSRARRA